MTIYCIPQSLIEKFTTSGQRQVIAIEMTLAPPSPSAISSSLSVEVEQPPVEIEPPILIEPREQRTHSRTQQQQERATSMPVLLPDPEIPGSDAPRLSKRQALPTEVPKITQLRTPRPRRPHSISITPLASVPPLEMLAGLSETQAEFLSNPPPKYPAEAVADRLEGTVKLRLSIDRQGQVTRADVLQSSGSVLLDEAARTAVMTWSGKPATRGGHAIESEEILPIRFRL